MTVKGNKVQNGDFQASTNGRARQLDGSGSTSYDGNAAKAGPGGSWTSDADPGRGGADVRPRRSTSSGAATAVVQQLSALGAVLASAPLGATLTPLAGVTQVRIVLKGGLAGVTTFDNVWMAER